MESIRGTPEHPFFTPNGMVAMGELTPGMEVSTRDTEDLLVVKAVTRKAYPDGIAVYNFETEDHHTYFVGWASGGISVHNMCAMQDGDRVNAIAKEFGMNQKWRELFGRAIEKFKYKNKIPNNGTLSPDTLRKIAEELLTKRGK